MSYIFYTILTGSLLFNMFFTYIIIRAFKKKKELIKNRHFNEKG